MLTRTPALSPQRSIPKLRTLTQPSPSGRGLNPKRKCRDITSRHFCSDRPCLLAYAVHDGRATASERCSRPAKDAAENAAGATAGVAIAAVSIAAVLSEALCVALLEAAAKRLRGSVLPIVRSLRAVALTTLRVARAGVQAVLVTLVHGCLIALATVVAIATVVAVITIVAVVPVATIVTVITTRAIGTAIAIPIPIVVLPPITVSALVVRRSLVAIASALLTIVSVTSILCLGRHPCGRGYAKYKSERQNRAANLSA